MVKCKKCGKPMKKQKLSHCAYCDTKYGLEEQEAMRKELRKNKLKIKKERRKQQDEEDKVERRQSYLFTTTAYKEGKLKK